MKITKMLVWAVLLGTSPIVLCGCDDDDTVVVDDFQVPVTLPQRIEIVRGSDGIIPLDKPGYIQPTDEIYLRTSGGVLIKCPITNIGEQSFSIAIPESLEEGNYYVLINRGQRRKNLGLTNIKFVEPPFEISEGTTIYGIVRSGDTPVKGVVVSDGYEVTATNDLGQYELKSQKKLNYVFISLPSGYEAKTDGVFPRIYSKLYASANSPEMISFELTPANQSKYKVLFLGDMHLADRTKDLQQFATVTSDINAYVSSHSGEKIYGITLGDMSWDLYWYSRSFGLDRYMQTVNSGLKNLPLFHTIGNHDNDMNATDNTGAKLPYRTMISPNYYSFNIGDVHYVVLDDIDCSAYDGTSSRNYSKQVTADQLAWLSKDLQYVDKSTPVVVMMHAPLYKPNSATGFRTDLKNPQDLLTALSGYQTVHFVTGHTHQNYNVTPKDAITNGLNLYEHNTAAICSDWWWSGNLNNCELLLSTDGTPSGYAIWDINGKNMSWIYKATGKDENFQMRTYDLNNVSFSMADVPNLSSSATAAVLSFKKYCDAYPANSKNEVLINVWNWNANWTINVKTENGQALSTTQVQAYDPLHVAAMTVKRFNDSGVTSAPNFITELHPHFFKVTAPDAQTDLVITVKDEFGHTYTENMARPKAFSVNAYK